MKKLLAILAALVLLLSACALAEESHKSGNWEYRLLDDGTAEIIKYNGKAKTLEIPSQLDGYSVTAIGAGAFAWYGRLTSITIPDSVKDVGANPFLNCNKLTKINVSQENEYLAVIDGVLFSKPDRRLVCCPTTKTGEYAIPQGICIIGEYFVTVTAS